MEIFIIIFACAGVGVLINTLTKREDARRQAKATAREMKKAFPSVGTQSSYNNPPEKTWRCTSCGHENSEKLTYCLHCHSNRHDNTEKVTCPHCGALNNKTNSTCFACRNSLKSEPKKEITSAENDNVALIKQLAELHKQGILSDEEFETKKTELLSKM